VRRFEADCPNECLNIDMSMFFMADIECFYSEVQLDLSTTVKSHLGDELIIDFRRGGGFLKERCKAAQHETSP
jgi:hypothetical protein